MIRSKSRKRVIVNLLVIDATIHNKAVANNNEGQEEDNRTNRHCHFGSDRDRGLNAPEEVVIDYVSRAEASRKQERRKHHDNTGFVRKESDLSTSVSILHSFPT